MIITKGALVNGTYSLMRISGLTVSPSPEAIQEGMQVADDYAAELRPFLDIGWQQPSNYGLSDPADNSGLSDSMAGPFKKLLFVELCGYFGKPVPQSVAITAAQGMRTLEQLIVTVPDANNPPTLPFGSGNEFDYRDRKFYSEPANNNDAEYVFKDNILNYSHDFSNDPNWLVDDVLDTVTWESQGTGVAIGTETNTDTVASAELTFIQTGGYAICITATKVGSTDSISIRKNFIITDCLPSGLRFT